MNALSRRPLEVGDFTKAMLAANPGLSEAMIRINLSALDWLEEVRICYGTDYRPAACPRDVGGAGPGARIRIWRAER